MVFDRFHAMRHRLDAPYKIRQREQPQLSENGEETLNRRL